MIRLNSILLLLLTGSVFLFTTNCDDDDGLKDENKELKDSLENHHCIYGGVSTHDIEKPTFKGGSVYIWLNTSSEPSNTSSGYDKKGKAEVNYNEDGLDIQIDGLPAGTHWVRSEATAEDTT
ncbi:MAG: hypothetical protein ABEH43_09395 [Flavobacteriales bacterium]